MNLASRRGRLVAPLASLTSYGALPPLLVLMAGAGGGDGTLWRLCLLLLLAPVLEEVIFRAGVQEALLRSGRSAWFAIVTTAMLFGAVHVTLRADAAAFVVAMPALAIGVVYARTRRVLPCVLLHAAMNAAWVAWQSVVTATQAVP